MTLIDTRPAAIAPVSPAAAPAPTTDPTEARLPVPGDRRFSYRHLWDRLGQPVEVTHIPSGLAAVMEPRSTFRTVTPGKAIAAINARAVDMLADSVTSPTGRALAIHALHLLDGIGAYCTCGGLLHYGIGAKWVHVNVCTDCLDDPTQCTVRREQRHKGCATPGPVQCEHNCRRLSTYASTRGCGDDKRCCGEHGCDTAMESLRAADRMFVPAQVPAVTELQVR